MRYMKDTRVYTYFLLPFLQRSASWGVGKDKARSLSFSLSIETYMSLSIHIKYIVKKDLVLEIC
jgi:hypothetical protein